MCRQKRAQGDGYHPKATPPTSAMFVIRDDSETKRVDFISARLDEGEKYRNALNGNQNGWRCPLTAGSPPPMSRTATWSKPACSLISSASLETDAAPCGEGGAIMGRIVDPRRVHPQRRQRQ